MDPGVKKVVRIEAADRHPLNAIPTPRGLLAAAPPAAEAALCLSLDGLGPPELLTQALPPSQLGRVLHSLYFNLAAQKLGLSGWLGLLHPNVTY